MTRTLDIQGCLADRYRAAVRAAGGRWNASAGKWAAAAEAELKRRGRVTAAGLRRAHAGGSTYSTAYKQLERMEQFGMLESRTCGQFGRAWFRPSERASKRRSRPGAPTPGHDARPGRAPRRGESGPPGEEAPVGMGERILQGEDELRQPRGDLNVARWHVEQAKLAVIDAQGALEGAGQPVAALADLIAELDTRQRQLAIIAGADPTVPPLDLKQLDRRCEEARDWDRRTAVPEGIGFGRTTPVLPHGILEAIRR